MNGLINLSRQLYEMKVTNENLVSKNKELEEKVTINEELIVMTMLSCTELYEMVLSNDENVSACELEEIETFSSNMVTIYANLIKRELKTLEQVPSIIRSEVEELLEVLLED